jgi:hypothetical protein
MFMAKSESLLTFEHAIQDAADLLNHFDELNAGSLLPSGAEVLKRASLVMALAALETYMEDRITEAVNAIASKAPEPDRLANFYKASLDNDLKYFHTPSVERVKTIFDKYLGMDVTEGWCWNHYDPSRARTELNRIVKKRCEIAHRSMRPVIGQSNPHAVTRDELRKHIRFIRDLVEATDTFIGNKMQLSDCIA